MNTKIYIRALLLLLAITATQYALIGDLVGDVVNTTGNVVDDAINTADNVLYDTEDVVYAPGENLVDDVIYTPYVAADKAVHPIRSVSAPVKTTADIVPVRTYPDYRSDYYTYYNDNGYDAY